MPRPVTKRLAAWLLAGALVMPALPAFAEEGTKPEELDFELPPMTREHVEWIVRDYLLSNPEVLEEAYSVLQERREREAKLRMDKALTLNADAYFNDPADPLIGNPDGTVNLVEFFDYQCGYCKSMAYDLDRRLTPDGKIRAKFKEFPILGPESVTAARAALAAEKQGKYWELHQALMNNHQRLSENRIFALAESVGLNIPKLRKDMDDPSIDNILQRNRKLADDLGITGTPGFVIGTDIYRGSMAPNVLDAAIEKAERTRTAPGSGTETAPRG